MTPHVNGQAGKQGVIDLQRRIGKIRKHATALQKAIEDRNERIRQLKAEKRRLCELVHDLQNTDGWPDDDKLLDYGIDPSEVHDV